MTTLSTVAHQILLIAHTMAFAFAIVAVVREDIALLTRRSLDVDELERAARFITLTLAVLWATGLALVAIDVGLDPDAIAAKPKLAAKLTVVSILTLNGIALHAVVFPILTTAQRSPRSAAAICTVFGAISSATWSYAAFVGLARIIAPSMTYGAFLALYAIILAGALGIGLILVRPRVERLIIRDLSAQPLPDDSDRLAATAT